MFITKKRPTKKNHCPRRPKLRFTPNAWAKLLFLRDLGPTEVGAFGIAHSDDLLLVEEIQLVQQRCTETYVAFDDVAVAEYFERQVDLGRRPEQCGRIWIHTHPGRTAQPKTIQNATTVIRQLVNFALSRKIILKDPLEGLKNPRPKRTEQPCWTKAEVEQIITAAQEPQKSIYMALADTGMRIGELEWLTWEDIDLVRNLILIRQKEGWKPKSGDARSVPISPRLRSLLESRPRRFRWVFTSAPSRVYPKGDHQISERRLLNSLKALLKRIGLPTTGKLHTFRHSFISLALMSGVAPAIVRSWVGHVSGEILEHYTHVHHDPSQEAMCRLFGGRSSAGSSTDLAKFPIGAK